MNCDICGKKGARVRRVTRSCGRGRSTFLIENVPLITCPSCGENYLTADTLKEIERIRLHLRKLTVPKRNLSRASAARPSGATQRTAAGAPGLPNRDPGAPGKRAIRPARPSPRTFRPPGARPRVDDGRH